MKHLSAFFTIFFLFLFAACSSTEQITVYQMDEAITVDGSTSDWNTSDTVLKENDDVRYLAAVYDDFLHLYIDVRSHIKENTIRQLGLIVYLSNSESDRKKVGIAYPPGVFNLLRDNPGMYNSFLTDEEWGHSRENIELMNDLEEDLFSRVMIVDRPDGSNAEYGFVDRSRLEIDGFEIYADEERGRLAIEMRIPIDNTSVFNLQKEDLWLGFAIEPPQFRFRNDNDQYLSQRRRGVYGQRQPYMQPRRSSQSMPSKEEWFILSFN
jgi:hypothetical protein